MCGLNNVKPREDILYPDRHWRLKSMIQKLQAIVLNLYNEWNHYQNKEWDWDHSMSQVALVVKNLLANAGDIRDTGLIHGSGRSPGGGHGNPLQYYCLENPWTEEPGGLQFMGLQRVRHNWSSWAHTHTRSASQSISCTSPYTSVGWIIWEFVKRQLLRPTPDLLNFYLHINNFLMWFAYTWKSREG